MQESFYFYQLLMRINLVGRVKRLPVLMNSRNTLFPFVFIPLYTKDLYIFTTF